MKKTMMYLPDELHGYLIEEAGRRGASMAEIAREAISEHRARCNEAVARSLSAIIGIIEDNDPHADWAHHVDEPLEEYYAPGGTWDKEHGIADPHRH